MNAKQPTTIEQDWERFYAEYPHIYDKFAVSSIEAIKHIVARFGLQDKVILDVGSGTGVSTYEIAKFASEVIGLEPGEAMRAYAKSKRTTAHQNVRFLDYAAESEVLPLDSDYLDAIISIYAFPFWFHLEPEKGQRYAKRFMTNAMRILKEGGVMITVENSTGWEAGEITAQVLPKVNYAQICNQFMEEYLGFAYEDVTVVVDYDSVDNMIATFGFIFGQRAIDYISEEGISQIDWKLRVHFLYK